MEVNYYSSKIYKI